MTIKLDEIVSSLHVEDVQYFRTIVKIWEFSVANSKNLKNFARFLYLGFKFVAKNI